jgi:hypothetical protein
MLLSHATECQMKLHVQLLQVQARQVGHLDLVDGTGAAEGTLARFGPTTPKRARRPSDASVDHTEAGYGRPGSATCRDIPRRRAAANSEPFLLLIPVRWRRRPRITGKGRTPSAGRLGAQNDD